MCSEDPSPLFGSMIRKRALHLCSAVRDKMSCCSKTPVEAGDQLRERKMSTLSFPMYTVPLETVLEMKKVRPHQELLKDGVLKIFDSAHGRAMFVSHQWTTETHPDPEARQLKARGCAKRLGFVDSYGSYGYESRL